MSIFDRLKNAILGTKLHAGPVETGSPTHAAPPAAPSTQASGQAPRATPTQNRTAGGPKYASRY